MAKESFMLVSLKEDKAKKLAHVMANPTCTRILDYLAGKDATESQIAKDLGIPLSTVHYNLQQLVEAKLVLAEEFHYSEKGREVNHYKLANKFIIIAPQDDPSFLEHLKKYLPVAVITAGVAVVLKSMQFFTGSAASATMEDAAPSLKAAAAPEASRRAVDTVTDAAIDSAADAAAAAGAANVESFAATAPVAPPVQAVPWWQSPLIDYFLLGALFVLLVIVVIEAVNYWRRKQKLE